MSPTCPGRTCDDQAAALVHPPQANLAHGGCTIAVGANLFVEDAWNLLMTLFGLSISNVFVVFELGRNLIRRWFSV